MLYVLDYCLMVWKIETQLTRLTQTKDAAF